MSPRGCIFLHPLVHLAQEEKRISFSPLDKSQVHHKYICRELQLGENNIFKSFETN